MRKRTPKVRNRHCLSDFPNGEVGGFAGHWANEAQAPLLLPTPRTAFLVLTLFLLESLTTTETVDGSARDVATRPPFGRWPVSVEELEGR
jgi:hypothetical protein